MHLIDAIQVVTIPTLLIVASCIDKTMLLAADVINGKSVRSCRSIGPRSNSRSNRGSRSFEDPTGHRDDSKKTQSQQQNNTPRLARRLSKVSNNKTNIDTPIVEENVEVVKDETIDKKLANYGRTLHEQNRIRAVKEKEKIKVTSDDAIIKSEAFAVFDELQTITKKQALIALELTKPSWDAIGYGFSLEDPNDPKTMELCVKRVTALFWIRLIAIGIMEAVIEESELYGDSMNSNIDLSTTTLCRWILREPKEEARNPQDDAAEAGFDANKTQSSDAEGDERFPIDTRNFKGNSGVEKKKFCYSKFSSEPLQVPCWWWPTEQQNMYQSPRRRNFDIPPKPWEILVQLRLFIQRMFLQHRKDLPFHNYTHSAVVVVRCNKLLDMILCTTDDDDQTKLPENDEIDGRSRQSSGSLGHVSNSKRNDTSEQGDDSIDCEYYDEDLDFGKRSPPAFGLRKDPIAQFALLFSGLIHDVQHHGVTNRQLCIEEHELSLIYNDQSVQEKNSLKIAFYELIKPNYNSLRTVLFGYSSYSSTMNNSVDDNMIMNSRYRYFRQTVVNAVLTTDIASPEQTVITKMKWKEAFCQPNNHSHRQGNRNQMNNQNRNQLSNVHVTPMHQLHVDRRLSVASEVSLPQALTKGALNLNGRQPGNFNRRGSNVSAISEFTDDSYGRNQQHVRGSGVVSGGRSNFGKLETVRSQHQMKQDHEFEYNDDHNNYSSYHANRRGSAASIFSSDSVAMMNHPSHSHVQPRRISTSMRQRRPSNESLGSYNHDHQQRRRQSNESYAGQHYLQNNNNTYNVGNSYHEDDVSYDGSEFVNDSEVVYSKSQGNGPRQMDRRMSAASYDSYSASDWGGDSVAHLNHRPNNRRDSPSSNSNNEGIIQHRRYPHANGCVSNVASDSFDKGNYSQNQSLDLSSTEQTLGSIAANSVEINKKRLEDTPPTTSSRNNSNLKGNNNANKVTKKIMMETDGGDEVDISRYVWKGDNESEGSFSLTPPSSVEDEYGGYAHEYAAQFKAGGTAGVTLPGSTMAPSSSGMQNVQSIQNPTYQDELAMDALSGGSQSNGEYCGRVIVATTRTNRPIDRRSSVSGAIASKGRPQVDHTDASNSTRFMAGQMPVRGRINRRASTGTFRVSGQSTALQGASIDENNPAAYGMEHHDKIYTRTHSMQATQSASRIHRGSLGTLMSQDGRQENSSVTSHSGQLNSFDYQSTVSNIAPDGLKKYKKRLGIRRSMDLSGESIETYSGHGESRLMNDMLSVQSNENGRGNMMDYDEPDELRAAVVIETLLRVADVGHSIQNWENMTSWSSKLFRELCNAHRIGRGHDPRSAWYTNQIGIMDSYLRPLAFQLDELGVFGEFNGVLFVQCVDAVRSRWIDEGEGITEQLIQDVEQSKTDPEMDMMRFL